MAVFGIRRRAGHAARRPSVRRLPARAISISWRPVTVTIRWNDHGQNFHMARHG
jgi:hypothetical protein